MRSHSETFERKGDAERILTLIEAQMIHGDWTDPKGVRDGAGAVPGQPPSDTIQSDRGIC
jgi:hypothetical protein